MGILNPTEQQNPKRLSRVEKAFCWLIGCGIAATALPFAIDNIDGGDMRGEKLVRVDEGTDLYEAVIGNVVITGLCNPLKVVDTIAEDERNQDLIEEGKIIGSGLIYTPASCD